MNRLLPAAALAPLAVVPVLAVLYGPWAITAAGLSSLISVVVAALFVSYPATVLFGIPVHVILEKQRWRRLSDYVTTGALLGGFPVVVYCLVAIVVDAKFVPSGLWTATVRNAEWGAIGTVVFALSSAAVAAVFWRIAAKDSRRTPFPRRPGGPAA